MAFKGKAQRSHETYSSPEEMYLSGALKRTTQAVPALWLHQGDVIRKYAEDHQGTADLALELPTGTGKTIPGLLIGEWVRRKEEGPVLYAAPTTQLARQVLATASREGIPAVLLVGSHHNWPPAGESAVEGGEAIGITNYSTVFNSRPKTPVPRLLLLDDAHAGEQFAGDEYGVSINRYRDPQAYEKVLTAISPFLSGLLIQRLRGEPDPGAHHQVRLILPSLDGVVLTALDTALSQLTGNLSFAFSMIRAGLPSCCVYLSYGGIQIRPMVPPTFENKVFNGAKQRIYLSATLGTGGELERAFGQSQITRMPLPTKTPPRSGRRLFVFPDLAAGGDSEALTKQIVAVTDKALILAHDTIEKTEQTARNLAGNGVPVFGKTQVEHDLGPFAAATKGVLGLANRYDGLDLPGEACRIVVLSGKPDATNLQEKFLGERADASAALAERLRTRIVQGAGRCTRGPNDYAVVVVRGSDITKYFSKPENRRALEPELQAEIDFGWRNSLGAQPAEILDNVKVFLEHGEEWRDGGEPALAEFRRDAVKTDPPGAHALGEAAPVEVAAWDAAYAGDWVTASDKAVEAARLVGKGSDATRGYRGVLLYLAGVWLFQGATDEAQRARARALVRQAEAAAANRGNWLREMRDLPGAEEVELAGMDVVAVNAIVSRLTGQLKPNRVTDDLRKMGENLDQNDAATYENGLTLLGTFLGAESYKPEGDGRCDAAWVWDTSFWMTVEAKSEQDEDGVVALRYVRQANTQLEQLAHDRGHDYAPAGSVSVIVSDRQSVDPQHAPTANRNLYLATPELVAEIAADVEASWADFLATAAGVQNARALRAHVREVLTAFGCLPTQVAERMTQNRIRPED
jgi:hypothetical protein